MHSKASTIADDSGTGVKGGSTSEIIPKLEGDGENVLKYNSEKNEIKKFAKTIPIWITCILSIFSHW